LHVVCCMVSVACRALFVLLSGVCAAYRALVRRE